MGFCKHFFPGLCGTVILQISTSKVPRIIGISHWHLAGIWTFKAGLRDPCGDRESGAKKLPLKLGDHYAEAQ
jgi:hypothetical protein